LKLLAWAAKQQKRHGQPRWLISPGIAQRSGLLQYADATALPSNLGGGGVGTGITGKVCSPGVGLGCFGFGGAITACVGAGHTVFMP